jgi:imidazole glycerol-phosphate synthase subunit HisH
MIAIIKYNAGNSASVKNAVDRLGYECVITSESEEISKADKVILPGVGEASSAMKYLKENELDQVFKRLTQPVLGICLGQQLMCKYSEEGQTECLGIYDAIVKKFPATEIIPHMGWNNIEGVSSDLFYNFDTKNDVYFVHSYYVGITQDTTSVCNYILPFSASMQKDNYYSTQFHPEKSASVGEKILLNFLQL